MRSCPRTHAYAGVVRVAADVTPTLLDTGYRDLVAMSVISVAMRACGSLISGPRCGRHDLAWPLVGHSQARAATDHWEAARKDVHQIAAQKSARRRRPQVRSGPGLRAVEPGPDVRWLGDDEELVSQPSIIDRQSSVVGNRLGGARWKPALNAFTITFADPMPAAEDR